MQAITRSPRMRRNSDGASGSKGITITVRDNEAPTVAITAPSNGAAFACPATVTFRGSVRDKKGEQLVPKLGLSRGNAAGSGSIYARSATPAPKQAITISPQPPPTAKGHPPPKRSPRHTVQIACLRPIPPRPHPAPGVSRVFQFLYLDPNGVSDIQQVQAQVGTNTAQANACYIQYLPATNRQDCPRTHAGTGWYTAKLRIRALQVVSRTNTVQAGYGRWSCGQRHRPGSNVALTFKTPSMASKLIFTSATDQIGATTNWQTRGTWNNPRKQRTFSRLRHAIVGKGSNQVFQFAYSVSERCR